MKKCKKCSTLTKSVYHAGKCPYEVERSGIYLWIPDDERPIEKAHNYLKRTGYPREVETWGIK